MLIIRDEQKQVFQQESRRRFEVLLADFLREHYPAARRMAPELLSGFVHTQVSKAGPYGLVSRRGAALFVAAAWHLGDGFDLRLRGGKRPIFGRDTFPSEREAMLEDLLHELGAGVPAGEGAGR
ncbi:hypothetical protein HUA74_09545 [Myxococcus sp. CA051A]|uniref:hypothetical protein n=1 Tax=Myxococcus sp. CA051A TaxID=2741739 RepID=UPI00157B8330|nr:hypothetical protein [Myxococcus sp. CA051A]NTX60902.1 hypothetical protein [Myxococcus sp. CA051A]